MKNNPNSPNKLKDQEIQLLKIMIFLGVVGLVFSLFLTLVLN